MRALTVIPGQKGSARLESLPDPQPEKGAVLVEALALGICGTDREILSGDYGWPPPGQERLILGHESLGRVLHAPSDCGFAPGDLIVGIVRRPDPVPCPNCAVGEWDMCRNGLYTEHGIKELHGFCSERYRVDPRFAVKLAPSLSRTGVLLEPTSVVAKAWEHIERIGQRCEWRPQRLLVTGAGPIGLLAAMIGVQRGLETHVLDRVTDGPKPGLVEALGAHYHVGSVSDASKGADIIVECTGVGSLVFEAIENTAAGGIACLAGISSGGRSIQIDGGQLNREIVLENDVVFGSVNANRRHYEQATAYLAQADPDWLNGLITRRLPLEHWSDALAKRTDDVKVVIDFTQ